MWKPNVACDIHDKSIKNDKRKRFKQDNIWKQKKISQYFAAGKSGKGCKVALMVKQETEEHLSHLQNETELCLQTEWQQKDLRLRQQERDIENEEKESRSRGTATSKNEDEKRWAWL